MATLTSSRKSALHGPHLVLLQQSSYHMDIPREVPGFQPLGILAL